MVGFVAKPAPSEEQQELHPDPKPKNFKDPIDPEIEDFTSLVDSFIDFDSISWLDDNTNPNSITFGDMETVQNWSRGETPACNWITPVPKQANDALEPERKGLEAAGEGFEPLSQPKAEKGLTCSIEQVMGNVSLSSDCGHKIPVKGEYGAEREIKRECDETGDGSESESSSSSSASRSSDSSSSDDEDDNMELKAGDSEAVEIEEGEIKSVDGEKSGDDTHDDDDDDQVDEMIAWSDADSEDEDVKGVGVTGPIRSRNELQELPPVPPVDVTLQPHHSMSTVGVVMSIMGAQVIVEGVEKHNPLSERSILWITEKKAPLGLVDEIFGPVKNPYYIVRYNSESEVPAGICHGTLISFVQEFADHVLNDKNLYVKGYDASGENDEEVSDEAEFSDDEKEAEYRRMKRMAKREMNEHKPGNMKDNRKKMRNRRGLYQQNKNFGEQTRIRREQASAPPNQDQHVIPANFPLSPAFGQSIASGSGVLPPFQPMPQTGGFIANGMPNRPVFPVGLASNNNNVRWPPQHHQHHPYSIPMPNQIALPNQLPVMNQLHMQTPFMFQQQLGPGQMSLPNMVVRGAQANMFAGSSCPPWASFAGQNYFDQTPFGFGFRGQALQDTVNSDQGMLPNGSSGEQNGNLQAHGVSSCNFGGAPEQGRIGSSSSSRGRKSNHRGGSGFRGRGRGRLQPR